MHTPAEIAKNYVEIGAAKTRLPTGRLVLLSVLAGIFIALAGVGSQTVAVSIPMASLGKFLGACIFPAGLAMVLLAGSELFTGNTLIVISVLEKRASWGGLLRNWILVYLGNLVGGILVAACVTYGHTLSLFDNGLAAAVVSGAAGKVNLSFTEGLLRGILCNLLVCLGVWISFAAKDVAGKILGLFFPVMLFVLCGYEHCVANMYFIPAGIFASAEYGIAAEGLTWGAFFVNNLIPVTLGNILGGAGIVGCGYWVIYLRDRER